MPYSMEKTLQDKKDLARFSKYFTLKMVQVIIQSRLGEKIQCISRVTSVTSDWFNLCIEDNMEIEKRTKAVFGTRSIPITPIVVEISLKPTDSEPLPVELWKIHFEEHGIDQYVRIVTTVYNRMSLLLKSIISVSRVIPAYKLSRMKGSDYQMLYTVLSGPPDYNKLGQECRIVKLGAVVTPFGSLCVEFGYRTNMALSIESCGMNPVLMKSNHYSVDDSVNGSQMQDPFKPIPLPRIPAFSEPLTLPSEELEPLDIPFGNLLRRSSIHANKSPRDDPPPMIIEDQDISSESDTTNPVAGGADFELITMTTMKPIPFAPFPDPGSDPASFFSTLQNPPPLESFESQQPAPVADIDKQLETFENNLTVFEEFVKNLCLED